MRAEKYLLSGSVSRIDDKNPWMIAEQGVRLACFIAGDREAATRIVTEAMGRLDVTTAAKVSGFTTDPSSRPG